MVRKRYCGKDEITANRANENIAVANDENAANGANENIAVANDENAANGANENIAVVNNENTAVGNNENIAKIIAIFSGNRIRKYPNKSFCLLFSKSKKKKQPKVNKKTARIRKVP